GGEVIESVRGASGRRAKAIRWAERRPEPKRERSASAKARQSCRSRAPRARAGSSALRMRPHHGDRAEHEYGAADPDPVDERIAIDLERGRAGGFDRGKDH